MLKYDFKLECCILYRNILRIYMLIWFLLIVVLVVLLIDVDFKSFLLFGICCFVLWLMIV